MKKLYFIFSVLSGLVFPGAVFMSGLVCITDAAAQQRRAVVIGIGDYPEESGWRKINGDKDIDVVVPMLLDNGFEKENITVLSNAEATKSSIKSVFESLAGIAGPGDALYIHFSGHGQQVIDISGDEPDGYDEALIPYDAVIKYGQNGYKGENHILDDELGVWLEALRKSVGHKGVILVALDACHSGDATRGESDEPDHVRGTSDIFEMSGAQRSGMGSSLTDNGQAERNQEIEWICLSACKSYQNNYEYKSESGYCGRLSWAVSKVLRPGMKFKDFIEKLEDLYESMPLPPGPPQNLDVEVPAMYNLRLF